MGGGNPELITVHWHSYAAGPCTNDPEEIWVIDPSNADGVPEDERAEFADEVIFAWSGNGYAKHSSWISAEEEYVIDLDDCR
jgi:hypothetical protein